MSWVFFGQQKKKKKTRKTFFHDIDSGAGNVYNLICSVVGGGGLEGFLFERKRFVQDLELAIILQRGRLRKNKLDWGFFWDVL